MRRALGWVTLSVLGAGAFAGSCTATDEALLAALGGGCLLDSDCEGELVCVFRRCHQQCTTTADCPTGLACRLGDPPTHVCQLDDENRCALNSDCPEMQICGPDLVCRDRCLADPDCLEAQQCVQKLCADPSDLVDGGLPLVDELAAEGQPCAVNSQCKSPLLCLDGLCLFECTVDADCPSGQCNPMTRRCDEVQVDPPCVPGKQEACTCATGDPGVQVCGPDLSFGECTCLPGTGGGGGMGPPCTLNPTMAFSSQTALAQSDLDLGHDPVNNHVLMGGTFTGATDFGAGTVSPGDMGDMFLVRYDADLNLQWVRTYGSVGAMDEQGEVVVDSAGNTIALGSAPLGLTFPGETVAIPFGVHLLKIDAMGNQVWGRNLHFSSSFMIARRHAMGLDAADNIFIAGNFDGSIDLGGMCGAISSGSDAWFLAKLDPAGVCQWIVDFPAINNNWNGGSGSFDAVSDLAVDGNGDVVVVGAANLPFDFGGGNLPAVGVFDAYVARFSGANGAHLGSWRYDGGAMGQVSARSVDTDGTDLILGFASRQQSGVDFGAGLQPCSTPQAVFGCAWLTRFDAQGNQQWQHQTSGNFASTRVAVGPGGEAYWFGTYDGVANNALGSCPLDDGGMSMSLPLHLVRTEGDGTVWWAQSFPVTSGTGFSRFPDIVTSPQGDVFIVANAPSGATIDLGIGPVATNAFLLRIRP